MDEVEIEAKIEGDRIVRIIANGHIIPIVNKGVPINKWDEIKSNIENLCELGCFPKKETLKDIIRLTTYELELLRFLRIKGRANMHEICNKLSVKPLIIAGVTSSLTRKFRKVRIIDKNEQAVEWDDKGNRLLNSKITNEILDQLVP